MSGEQLFGKESREVVEKYDIEEIPEAERTQNESSLFYLWFASNLTIGDFALGFLPMYLGLSIDLTVIALVIGNLLGGMLLALMSVMGPKSGLPQMMVGRRPFGTKGGSVMSVLQWGNTAGWLTVNLILSSFALSIAAGGLNYIYSIIIVAIIVALVAFIGHRFIHLFERGMSVVLGVLFAFVTYIALSKPDLISAYTPSYSIPAIAGFGVTLAASFSYIMAWGPYAADYSRYVSSKRSSSKVFWYTFVGGVVASFWLEVVGMLVGIISNNPGGNPVIDLNNILGRFGMIGLISLFLGGLAANALNLYSNSLSFRAAGVKLKRTYIVIIVTAISILIALVGYLRFYDFYETFLLILDYWITPWLGVLIADFFFVNRGKPFNMRELPIFNRSGIIAYIIAVVVSVPFMAPPAYYMGPIASLLGGVDISYYVSFLLAFALYVGLSRRVSAKYYKESTV